MDEKQFEKLPKAEQIFRWSLFLASNGYERELTPYEIEQLRQKHLVQGEPLKFK